MLDLPKDENALMKSSTQIWAAKSRSALLSHLARRNLEILRLEVVGLAGVGSRVRRKNGYRRLVRKLRRTVKLLSVAARREEVLQVGMCAGLFISTASGLPVA